LLSNFVITKNTACGCVRLFLLRKPQHFCSFRTLLGACPVGVRV
jgi:hypothetical protein